MNDENKLQTTKAEVKAITTAGPKLDAIEMTLMKGDLALLSTEQRKEYYGAVCESLGLNRLTQPFAYINLSGKLTLYARKEATEQLRKIYDVSVILKSRESMNDLYIVTATAKLPNGRTDEATGVISIANLKGENLANAVMKAETKAKRRVTLSICGLGLLDESEVSNVDHDGYVSIDQAHGVATLQKPEVLEAAKAAPVKSDPVKPDPVSAHAPSKPAPVPASSVPPPPPAQTPPVGHGAVNPPKKTEGQSPYVTYPEDLPPDAPRTGAPQTPAPNEAQAPKISQAQVKRLYTIASASGWRDAGLKQFLKEALDLDSTLQLSPKHYDWLCSVVEKHSFEQAMETLHRAQAGKMEAQDANH